jgi:small subunit ribosomal protein S1
MSQPHEPVPDAVWQRFVAGHAEGDVLTGHVVSVVPFGAFVDVGDGVHGLVHVSEWRTPIEADTTVSVRILHVDGEQRRISLVPA